MRARPQSRWTVERPVGEGTRPARLVISGRALVFGVVLLAAFTLLFPTVRNYLRQRAELDALSAQVRVSEQSEQELRGELDRWDDPAFIAAQARERLSFVLPGETSYRVVDPEIVTEEPEPGDAGPTLPSDAAALPWYTAVWESVRIAGEMPVEDER
jgi:cell division protein FtsB